MAAHVFAVVLIFCLASTLQPAFAQVRVGVLAPLTGPGKRAGDEIKNAVILAAKDIKAQLLGTVPVVQMALSQTRFPTGTRPERFFRIAPSFDKLVLFGASFLVEQLKPKQIGLMIQKSAYGEMVKDIVEDRLGEARIPLVQLGPFSRGTTDFTPFALKGKSAPVDSVLFAGTEQELRLFLKAASEVGFRTMVMTSLGVGLAGVQALAETNPKITTYVAGYPDIRKMESAKEFVAAYRKEYGQVPGVGPGVTAYSATSVLGAALRGVGANASPSELAKRIGAESFRTPLGEIRFDANGNALWDSEAIWKLEPGREPTVVAQGTGGTPCDCKYKTCCENEPECKKPCPTKKK